MPFVDAALIVPLVRELVCRTPFARVPETHLVMEREASVEGYVDATGPGGALAGSHLFFLTHICEAIRSGETVVDLGCGPGSLLVRLARLDPGVRFIGVDLSTPMLGRAERAIAAERLDNVTLRVDDMTRLETIADHSVDAVISTFALHHLPDLGALDRAFAAIARVLTPGGGVCLCDLGRPKSLRSIDYMLHRAAGESTCFLEDTAQSFRAAFSRAELESAVRRHLGDSVRVYAPWGFEMAVVARTPSRRSADDVKGALRALLDELSPRRREDFRMLSAFMRLGGLKRTL